MTLDPTLAGRITAFVDNDFARETSFLAELVKVASDNPPGHCAGHAARAEQLLSDLDLTVEAHAVPQSLVHAEGMTSVTNLIVRHRFGDGPVIALNAHGDVVPPGLDWRVPPYAAVIEDSDHGPVMYGRGIAVSKSDFATYTWALLALMDMAKQGVALAGTLELHFTYDEEVSGNIGPKWLLDQGLTKPDMVIAAGFSYAIVTAHNGCLHFEVTVTGKQAHAAMPDTGVDALEAATVILGAPYAYREELARTRSKTPGIVSPTLNVGLIKGGINTNVVPDQVVFRIDRRMIPEEDPERRKPSCGRALRPRPSNVRGFRSMHAASCWLSRLRRSRAPSASSRRSSAMPRKFSGSKHRRLACRSIPMPATTQHEAFRSCSTAPDRARSWKRTRTMPTRTCDSTILPRRPRSSR
jgi:acetylornithine deacetylase/succinyl-diaminopimelate desuccinylase-like protein